MKAVLLISHGSRHQATLEEIRGLVDALKIKSGIPIFEYAFLEITQPGIAQGIDLCVQKGATEILVVLNFLNAGQHVDYDIPEILQQGRQRNPDVTIHMSRPLGQQPGIDDFFLRIIQGS